MRVLIIGTDRGNISVLDADTNSTCMKICISHTVLIFAPEYRKWLKVAEDSGAFNEYKFRPASIKYLGIQLIHRFIPEI